MKRIGATAVIVLGLAAATIAVAHGTESKAVKQVSATFAATTASDVHTTTCTGADGDSYALSRGTYTGTATSTEPSLNGPVRIDNLPAAPLQSLPFRVLRIYVHR